MGIPPNLRTNIDYVFILRENIVQNRKRIYECYAGMFPTFEIFCQVMDQTTENFSCLVIHNNSKSNKLEDQVFWYKAETHPPFKMGSTELWNFHKENYIGTKAPVKKEDQEWNPEELTKRKNVINVELYNEFL